MGWKDFCVFVFKRGDINATMGSNQGRLVMIGGTMAMDKTNCGERDSTKCWKSF